MSRIASPADGAALAAGSVPFGGIAFAGSRRISGVELSWDGRRSWQAAQLMAEFSPNAWRFWQLTATLPAGHFHVEVCARDGGETFPTAKSAATRPNGAGGYHPAPL